MKKIHIITLLLFSLIFLPACSKYRGYNNSVTDYVKQITPIGIDFQKFSLLTAEQEWKYAGQGRPCGNTYLLDTYTQWPGELFFFLLPDTVMVYGEFYFKDGVLIDIKIGREVDGP